MAMLLFIFNPQNNIFGKVGDHLVIFGECFWRREWARMHLDFLAENSPP